MDEIQKKIDSYVNDLASPYWNDKLPNHKAVGEEVFRLRQALTDMKARQPKL